MAGAWAELRDGGVAVRTTGGWGQLNVRPKPAWLFGGGGRRRGYRF